MKVTRNQILTFLSVLVRKPALLTLSAYLLQQLTLHLTVPHRPYHSRPGRFPHLPHLQPTPLHHSQHTNPPPPPAHRPHTHCQHRRHVAPLSPSPQPKAPPIRVYPGPHTPLHYNASNSRHPPHPHNRPPHPLHRPSRPHLNALLRFDRILDTSLPHQRRRTYRPSTRCVAMLWFEIESGYGISVPGQDAWSGCVRG